MASAPSLAVGDKVRLAFVPSAVTNIHCGATGTLADKPTTIAGTTQVKVKLDDGRSITCHVEWLEKVREKVPSLPCPSNQFALAGAHNPESLSITMLSMDCGGVESKRAEPLAAGETRKAIALVKGMAASAELAATALAVLSGN